MKSNNNVYPALDFFDLSQKQVKAKFILGKKISFLEVKRVLKKIKKPILKIEGKILEERILSIFLDPQIIFGPKNYILSQKKDWFRKINYFIKRNKPLQFTLLGFPFKMAVSLKTKRKMPDMGEIFILNNLRSLIKAIEKEHKPGAVINIYTEGGFGKFTGIPEQASRGYHNYLSKLVKKLGWSREIKIKALAEMEKNDKFKFLFDKNLEENKKAFQHKRKKFIDKYQSVYLPVFRLVNSQKYAEEILVNVYNEELKDSDCSKEVLKVRNDLRVIVRECIFSYFAYLKTRDDLDFLSREVPHYLALSVSPKPGRLGILPINRKINILPYHGVPVLKKNKDWEISYLIDLKRKNKKYLTIHLKGDSDSEPFYYQEA